VEVTRLWPKLLNSGSENLRLRLEYEGKGSGKLMNPWGRALPLHSQLANQRRIVSAKHSQPRHIANQLFNSEIPNQLQTPSSIGAVGFRTASRRASENINNISVSDNLQ
jgi:hypothetical protein